MILLPLAIAEDDVAALRMRPNDMVLPMIAAEVGATGTLEPAHPVLVDAALSFGGIPGPGATTRWLAVDGAASWDPGSPEPVAFSGRLTPWRVAGQTLPIVAASDLRVAAMTMERDRLLGIELGAVVQALDWYGGLYLPANHPGDIEARIVGEVRLLGVRWRRADDDFIGAALGGLGAELVYGRRYGGTRLTGHLGGRADWSVGDKDGFSTITDTEVWLGGVLELGDHHALSLLGGTRTTEDDAGVGASVPNLTVSWRSTW